MFAGGLLDKGPLSLRQREIVIDRTTAAAGLRVRMGRPCRPVRRDVSALAPKQVAATVHGPAGAACWTASEQALIVLVDELVDRHSATDAATWTPLTLHFDEAQILEAIALVGYYHAISFLCRGLELPLEAHSALSRAIAPKGVSGTRTSSCRRADPGSCTGPASPDP